MGNSSNRGKVDHIPSVVGEALRTVQHHIDWFTNIPTLIALGSALVALVSALYTVSMAKSARKAYELAARQDSRREPRLAVYLSDAQSLKPADRFEIAISITVANPTDIDNSVTRAELGVTYHRLDGRPITARLSPSADSDTRTLAMQRTLDIPASISSHQSMAGWLRFELPDMLVVDCVIDNYSLLLEDSHQRSTTIDSLFVREGLSPQEEAEKTCE